MESTPIKIAVDRESLSDGALIYGMRAGMGVQASIITGERSLLKYLLRPVYASFERVFTER